MAEAIRSYAGDSFFNDDFCKGVAARKSAVIKIVAAYRADSARYGYAFEA